MVDMDNIYRWRMMMMKMRIMMMMNITMKVKIAIPGTIFKLGGQDFAWYKI